MGVVVGGSLQKGEGFKPGGEGKYVFADLDELDGVIAEWAGLHNRIKKHGIKLSQAVSLISAPARDQVSQVHATYTQESLTKAVVHNDAMRQFARSYLDKLTAARAQYAESESQAVANLRQTSGG